MCDLKKMFLNIANIVNWVNICSLNIANMYCKYCESGEIMKMKYSNIIEYLQILLKIVVKILLNRKMFAVRIGFMH